MPRPTLAPAVDAEDLVHLHWIPAAAAAQHKHERVQRRPAAPRLLTRPHPSAVAHPTTRDASFSASTIASLHNQAHPHLKHTRTGTVSCSWPSAVPTDGYSLSPFHTRLKILQSAHMHGAERLTTDLVSIVGACFLCYLHCPSIRPARHRGGGRYLRVFGSPKISLYRPCKTIQRGWDTRNARDGLHVRRAIYLDHPPQSRASRARKPDLPFTYPTCALQTPLGSQNSSHSNPPISLTKLRALQPRNYSARSPRSETTWPGSRAQDFEGDVSHPEARTPASGRS